MRKRRIEKTINNSQYENEEDLYFTTLEDVVFMRMIAGFIHVPFLPEQNPSTGYTMELNEIVKGIQAAIQMLAQSTCEE